MRGYDNYFDTYDEKKEARATRIVGCAVILTWLLGGVLIVGFLAWVVANVVKMVF